VRISWWTDLARPVRWLVAAVVALAVLAAGTQVASSYIGVPGGPDSSARSATATGLAALARLVRLQGHRVQLVETTAALAGVVPGDATLVVADPTGISRADEQAVAQFVRSGGRLVAAGGSTQALLGAVLGAGRAPAWTSTAVPVASLVRPFGGLAPGATVASAGEGSWSALGALEPVLVGSGGILAGTADAGKGQVVAIADASVLQNAALATAENAAFALAAVSPSGQTVLFDEGVYGSGATGLGALPATWQTFLVLFALAALAWIWAEGRRLGPASSAVRALDPPRSAHLDATAAALARTRDASWAGRLLWEELASHPPLAPPTDPPEPATHPAVAETALPDPPDDLEGALAVAGALAARRSGRLSGALGAPERYPTAGNSPDEGGSVPDQVGWKR
jgi:hypothetical protein